MLHNFSWLIEGRLAGMGMPSGVGGDAWIRPQTDAAVDGLTGDLKRLKKQGVGALVSLTREPLNSALLRRLAFIYLHLPVPDMRPPALEQIGAFIDFVTQAQAQGRAVVVYCRAGLGRTGTMLACYLVWLGYSAQEAIAEVRAKRPYSIETAAQEKMVHTYAQVLPGNRE